jgi:hypothetical protein
MGGGHNNFKPRETLNKSCVAAKGSPFETSATQQTTRKTEHAAMRGLFSVSLYPLYYALT